MFLALAMAAAIGTQLLRMEHLCLAAPDDHTMEHRRGPDFSLFYVIGPESATSGSLGIYLGNHPRSFAPEGKPSSRAFRLGPSKGKWLMWETKADDGVQNYHAEATLKRPFKDEPQYSEFLHVFVVAASAERRAQLQALAETLHLASSDPRCPEPEPLKPGDPPVH